jgi:uncharacterized membrane protein YgcG
MFASVEFPVVAFPAVVFWGVVLFPSPSVPLARAVRLRVFVIFPLLALKEVVFAAVSARVALVLFVVLAAGSVMFGRGRQGDGGGGGGGYGCCGGGGGMKLV